MDRQRIFRRTLLAAALAVMGTTGVASATDEAEPNFPIGSAQRLTIGSDGSATVTGAIVNNADGSPDVDYYTFEAKAGDHVTLNIDGTSTLDSMLTVLGPWPNFDFQRENDDADPQDAASTNPSDARIDDFIVPSDGVYAVAVTPFQVHVGAGGGILNPLAESSGQYTLIITGVSAPVVQPPVDQPPVDQPPVTQPPVTQPPVTQPPVTQPPQVTLINIDIKPGDRRRTAVVSEKREYVPVALLSSSTFNPLQVDQKSITFGVKGDEASLKRCLQDRRLDVNRDRRPDLLCFFDADAAGFEPGDLEGILKGKTADGVAFEGRGMLKVVPVKKRHHNDDRRGRDDRRDGGRKGHN